MRRVATVVAMAAAVMVAAMSAEQMVAQVAVVMVVALAEAEAEAMEAPAAPVEVMAAAAAVPGRRCPARLASSSARPSHPACSTVAQATVGTGLSPCLLTTVAQ